MPASPKVAVLAIAASFALPAPAAAQAPDSLRAATLEAIHATVDQAFFDPAHLGVDWDGVGERYRARLATVESDSAFLRLATGMLRELPASHLDLLTGPAAGTADHDSRAAESSAPPALDWSPVSGPDGVWHARVHSFDALNTARIDALMTDLAGSRGVVLDVRGNEGGDVSFLDLAGRFIARQALVGGLVSRGWLEATGHPLDRRVPLDSLPVMGPPYDLERLFGILGAEGALAFEAGGAEPAFGGCVALLIDRETGSAAEAFAMAIDRWTETPLIGEPTAGALLSSSEFPLPNGWRLRVPVAVGVDETGRIFRDEPIEPDVRIVPAGDEALEAALRAVAGCARADRTPG